MDGRTLGKATHLIKMLKAWKRECNVDIKSICLEIVAAVFVDQWEYRDRDLFWYDWMIRDFFQYMINVYSAGGWTKPAGINDHIQLGDNWQTKTQSAYQRALKACEYEHNDRGYSATLEWQKIFGSQSLLTSRIFCRPQRVGCHREPDIEPILGTARELYGRVVWSHKVHEQDREIWSEKVCTMSRINIWLAGLTTFLAVISVKFPKSYAIIVTALLATATVCFVVWQARSDPGTKESKHRVVAKELLWCREQLLLLITACHTATPIDQLQSRLELLTREVTAVYKFAPDTSPEAYARADKMLKSGTSLFRLTKLMRCCPPPLRKNQKEG